MSRALAVAMGLGDRLMGDGEGVPNRTWGNSDDRLRQEVGSKRDRAWGRENRCSRGSRPRRKCESRAGGPGSSVWAEGVAVALRQGQRALRGAVSGTWTPRPLGASFPSGSRRKNNPTLIKRAICLCVVRGRRGPGVKRLGNNAALGDQ